MRSSSLYPLLLALLIPSPALADYITIYVPGIADPWLAGMPAGAKASGYTPGSLGVDLAPQNSPIQVAGLPVGSGTVLTFNVTGSAAYGPAPVSGPDTKFSGPEGMLYQNNYIHHLAGAENGLSDVHTPINALLGVFLGAGQPDASPAPATLDFRSTGNVAGGVGYTSLSPVLQQVFFIGDGLDGIANPQQIIVPVGATRLFLGTADGWEWDGNRGGYYVRVNYDASSPSLATADVPEPGTLALLVIGGLGLCGYTMRHRLTSMTQGRH